MILREIRVYKTLIRNCQMIFLFPKDGKQFDVSLLMKLMVSRFLSGFPLAFGLLGHLYQSITKNHIFEIVSSLYFINFILMYHSAYLMLFKRSDYLLIFLRSLSRMSNNDLKNYEKTVQRVEMLTKLISYSTWGIISAMVFESYVRNSFCNNKEYVDNPNYVCGCLIPIWIPLKTNLWFVKPIFALYIYITSILYIPIMASGAALYFGSVEFIIIKMNRLMEYLQEMDFKDRNKAKTKRQLLFCVEYYIAITGLVKEMNDSLGYIFAPTQNAYNNVLMGILGYLAIKLRSFPNALQMVLWIFVQWLSCHCGQKLEDASLLLRTNVFELSWYDMDPSLARIYKIFHSHVSLTLHMKIQPIIFLNMDHFSSIVKGAYSFLMYLLKM